MNLHSVVHSIESTPITMQTSWLSFVEEAQANIFPPIKDMRRILIGSSSWPHAYQPGIGVCGDNGEAVPPSRPDIGYECSEVGGCLP